MTTPRERRLAELRENADMWHASEIDYATFTETRQDIWQAIRNEGIRTAHEVLQALRDQLPLSERCAMVCSSRLTGACVRRASIDGSAGEAHRREDGDSSR
jgi:hypothetical protein